MHLSIIVILDSCAIVSLFWLALCHFHEEMYMQNYKGTDDTFIYLFIWWSKSVLINMAWAYILFYKVVILCKNKD